MGISSSSTSPPNAASPGQPSQRKGQQHAPPNEGPAFLFGAIGGICNVMISHPFDLIKTRMQSGMYPEYTSTWRGLIAAYYKEGISGLYQGVSPVLIGAGPVMGTCYLSFVVARKAVTQWTLSSSTANSSSTSNTGTGQHQQHQLSIPATALAGAVAAIPTALLLGPADRIKILMQLESKSLNSSPSPASSPSSTSASTSSSSHIHHPNKTHSSSSPLHAIFRAIQRSAGAPPGSGVPRFVRGLPSLWRGTGLTMLRDAPGDAAYFGVFEGMKRWLAGTSAGGGDKGTGKPHVWHILLAGGLAGCANWIVCIPMDTVKTRIQQQQQHERQPHQQTTTTSTTQQQHQQQHASRLSGTPPPTTAAGALQKTSVKAVIMDIYTRQGIRGFYTGLGPVLVRTFPASAAFFFGVEMSKEAWTSFFLKQ